MRRLALVVLVVFLGGCGGGGVKDAMKSATAPQASAGDGEAVVRAWTREVYAGQFDRAASLFAPGAIVEQQDTIVLQTHGDAVAFNRSLPCRAKVTGVVSEHGGDTLLASFDLFAGPGGTCPRGGTARVRFRIRAGHIELWRQLPDAPSAPGQST